MKIQLNFILCLLYYTAFTQPKYDSYFLCISISNYDHNFIKYKKGFHGFIDIPFGNNSALLITKSLANIGIKNSVILLSNERTLITKKNIFGAINDLKKKISNDSSRKKIIFVYIISHGLGELFWNDHFIIPSNFNLDYSTSSREEISTQALSFQELSDSLNTIPNSKFQLFAECCFTIDNISPTSYRRNDSLRKKLTYGVYFDTLPKLFADPKVGFREAKLNEHIQNIRNKRFIIPCITSAKLGQTSSSVFIDSTKEIRIGKMAYSIIKAINKLEPNSNKTLFEFIRLILEDSKGEYSTNISIPETIQELKSVEF